MADNARLSVVDICRHVGRIVGIIVAVSAVACWPVGMKSRPDLLLVDAPSVPKVPTWARPRGLVLHDADAAYLAGAVLNSLDNFVRQDFAWAGTWRQRLALQSAAAAVNLSGRREGGSALRDAHFLRGMGDDPGPAGHILMAWRRLASRTTGCDEEMVRAVAERHFNLHWDDGLAEVVANAEDMVASARPAPVLAAEIAAAVYRARPDAELLGFWLADMVLAQKFRWPIPVPLLMGQVASAVFKSGENRKRIRPGAEGWGRAVILAYATAAAEACDLGADLASRLLLEHRLPDRILDEITLAHATRGGRCGNNVVKQRIDLNAWFLARHL